MMVGVIALYVFRAFDMSHSTPVSDAPRKSAEGARPSEMVIQPRPVGIDSSLSIEPKRLHLVAARLGSNARNGYADIGVDVMSPQTYRAGAILVNGARIEEVYLDRVLLVRGDKRWTLYRDGVSPAAPGDPSVVDSELAFAGGYTAKPVAAGIAESDALTQVLRITPRFDGEILRGVQVFAGARNDIFEALGLKPGDIIKAIDGRAIEDVDVALTAFGELPKGRALTVTLERDGASQLLSLDGAVMSSRGQGT
jgi:general secretion pathway protein C